jgi:hypothetical protein
MANGEVDNRQATNSELPWPQKWGNGAQIFTVLIALFGFLGAYRQLKIVARQQAISNVTSLNQVLGQCFELLDKRPSDYKPTTDAIFSFRRYVPSLRSAHLVSCFDLMKDLDSSRGDEPPVINVSAAKSLSIEWEDRFVEDLDGDATQFVEQKRSNCSFRADELERIRNDFVSWYMLIHPRDANLEAAYQLEIDSHRAKAKNSDPHARTFLHFADELEVIMQPCTEKK